MPKFTSILLLLLISLSQSEILKSRRSKHGEDCVSDAACEEGLVCKTHRCYTQYEAKHLTLLGLVDENVCDEKKKCKPNFVCYKHRCMDSLLAKEAQKQKKPGNPEEEEDVSMIFSGSIFLNKLPYLSGLKTDKTFNYDHLFTHVSNLIKHADISVALQETVFYIDQTGKPKNNYINTPKELGDAIAKAGFNTVLHATQSAYSKLDAGIVNTLNYWKNEHPNVQILGISKTESGENDYHIYEKKGVKIAIIDFASYLTKSWPKDKAYLIECGINLIIGNHPDYIQPISYVKAQNGNCGLVFFSLGQFIGDGSNSLGALAHVVVTKSKEKTYISSYSLRPVINHKIQSNQYTVYKLPEYTQELAKLTNKKIDVKKLRLYCKKVMGAFAFC